MASDKKGLSLKGINKSYGKVEAVKDISLEINPGEFFYSSWTFGVWEVNTASDDCRS